MLKHYDWSLLILLDACRYDYFARNSTIPGRLAAITSPASWTVEWLTTCFPDWYPDIKYISACPYIVSHSYPGIHSYVASDHFGEIVDVWLSGWSEELQTVPPNEVTKAALEAKNSKKVIAHYMQPHPPLIGDPPMALEPWGYARAANLGEESWIQYPFYETMIAKYGIEAVINAYVANLRLVLDEAKKLALSWAGKVVVTADHGEAFGEQGVYGHPAEVKTPETTTVPWLEVSHGV